MVSGRVGRRVRAVPANIAGACDDEQPPILEQCLKLHEKVPYTGTGPFEFAVHQGFFQSDTVGVTYRYKAPSPGLFDSK